MINYSTNINNLSNISTNQAIDSTNLLTKIRDKTFHFINEYLYECTVLLENHNICTYSFSLLLKDQHPPKDPKVFGSSEVLFM